MSDERTGRKSRIAENPRPARKRKYRSPEEREANKRVTTKTPRFLTPLMVRVLNNCFNPDCNTRADVAKASGVAEHTITRWMVEHDPFRAEYQRRLSLAGDELIDLLNIAHRLTFKFYIEVLSDRTSKYTTDDKFRAAKALLDVGKPRIETLTLQQVNVHGSQPAPQAPGVVPSVQRFIDAGASEPEAHRQDAAELRLILEQLMSNTFAVAKDEFNVIDGETGEPNGR